jgi:phosphate/sulfate permease
MSTAGMMLVAVPALLLAILLAWIVTLPATAAIAAIATFVSQHL